MRIQCSRCGRVKGMLAIFFYQCNRLGICGRILCGSCCHALGLRNLAAMALAKVFRPGQDHDRSHLTYACDCGGVLVRLHSIFD